MIVDVLNECDEWHRFENVKFVRDKKYGWLSMKLNKKEKFAAFEMFGFDFIKADKKEFSMIGEFVSTLTTNRDLAFEENQKLKRNISKLRSEIKKLKLNNSNLVGKDEKIH